MPVCENTHLLDQQTAVRSTMRHGLYKWKLDGNQNHICWDKEIVKTVHLQLLSNCKAHEQGQLCNHRSTCSWRQSVVAVSTSPNRHQDLGVAIPDGQIYNLAQMKWKKQGLHHKWLSHAMYTHATNSLDHR